MLSDTIVPFDISTLPDSHAEGDLLNFDDLLDIAREFEFTRTITHLWPESSTCPETELDDILAAIVPTPPSAEPSPIPPPSPAPSINQIHVQEVRPASVCPATSIPTDLVSLPKDDDQIRVKTGTPITSVLRGWSPPSGSQFLDLDDSLMLPESAKDANNPPWLATFLAPSPTQPVSDINEPLVTVSATGDVQPQTSATMPKLPPVNSTNKTDGPRKSVPAPVQPLSRAIIEPVRTRSAVANPTVPSPTAATSRAKTPKSRSYTPSTPATYARAPRGGIPPHVARSVTKANILRAEKERKTTQNPPLSTAAAGMKKPSVLRKVPRVETSKTTNDGSSGKKLLGWDENDEREERAVKRARVVNNS